jgi:hypothetical protein
MMYNLDVATLDNFYVGEQGWLVHNTDPFTAAELQIIQEAQHFFEPTVFQQFKDAFAAGSSFVTNVNGRPVIIEPLAPTSGFTLSGEGGFMLGKEAFKSDEELTKTIYQELYRLNTSEVLGGKGAVSGAIARAETDAAFSFAERAFAAKPCF